MHRKVNFAGQQQASGQTIGTPIYQQYAYKTVPKIEADIPHPQLCHCWLATCLLMLRQEHLGGWRSGQHSPGARRRAQHAFKFQKPHSAALHAAETTAAIRTLQDGRPCSLTWLAQPKAAFCNVSTAASSAEGGAVPTPPTPPLSRRRHPSAPARRPAARAWRPG